MKAAPVSDARCPMRGTAEDCAALARAAARIATKCLAKDRNVRCPIPRALGADPSALYRTLPWARRRGGSVPGAHRPRPAKLT